MINIHKNHLDKVQDHVQRQLQMHHIAPLYIHDSFRIYHVLLVIFAAAPIVCESVQRSIMMIHAVPNFGTSVVNPNSRVHHGTPQKRQVTAPATRTLGEMIFLKEKQPNKEGWRVLFTQFSLSQLLDDKWQSDLPFVLWCKGLGIHVKWIGIINHPPNRGGLK